MQKLIANYISHSAKSNRVRNMMQKVADELNIKVNHDLDTKCKAIGDYNYINSTLTLYYKQILRRKIYGLIDKELYRYCLSMLLHEKGHMLCEPYLQTISKRLIHYCNSLNKKERNELLRRLKRAFDNAFNQRNFGNRQIPIMLRSKEPLPEKIYVAVMELIADYYVRKNDKNGNLICWYYYGNDNVINNLVDYILKDIKL